MQYPENPLPNRSLKNFFGGLFNRPKRMGPFAFGASDIIQFSASPGTHSFAAWNAASPPEQSDPMRMVLLASFWKVWMRLRSIELIAA